MKKQNLWILSVLIVLLMSSIHCVRNWLPSTTDATTDQKLNFLIVQPSSVGPLNLSLRPEDSDRRFNALVLQNLVGTLTMFGQSGKAEPFLASKWNADASGKVWKFELRQGLKCEDGTVIDAPAYVENLKTLFRYYFKRSQNKSLMTFDDVVGIKEFLSGQTKDIKGLSSEGNSVVIQLNRPPDNLTEDLTQVYFGFWCPANFVNGDFRKDGKFTSSATYNFVSSTDAHVQLKLRPDWFRSQKGVAREVEIRELKDKNQVGSHRHTVVEAGFEVPNFKDINQFQVVPSSPAILTSLKVSPFAPSKFFKDTGQRRLFRQKIVDSNVLENLPKDGIHGSHFFYANAMSKTDPVKIPASFQRAKEPVKVCLSHTFSERVMDVIQSTVTDIFAKANAGKVEFEYVDRNRPNWEQDLYGGKLYDINVATVVIGGYFVNSQTKMMFCTDLGITFWDVSGRICKMVDEYGDKRPVDKGYIGRFNQVLQEDATVIPLFHSGLMYLYSKDIDSQSISTESANYPPLDTLKLLD